MRRIQSLFFSTLILFILLSLLFALPVLGGEEAQGDLVKPVFIKETVNLDGKLDEAVWKTKPVSEKFPTFSPIFGEVLPFVTDIWFAYDKKSLYFAFRCHDPEPGKIKTSVTSRDNINLDDRVSVSLDAVGSRQSCYHFYVNPNGIQGDSLQAASASQEDFSPDFVWYSAGRVTDQGYEVEIRIPLKSIGFKSGTKVNMGVLFRRYISRTGQGGNWPETKPGETVFNAHAPAMLKDLKKQNKLELLPSITYVSNQDRLTPDTWSAAETATEVSLGVKYGLSSSITLDLTYNPDFSQVESDALQIEVNQRYPLFYTEKRPFFMEGIDVFKFHTISFGFFPTPINTRQITDPLWGAKLTGSVDKFSFGVLASGDELPGQEWIGSVNPNQGKDAFFSVARGRYNIGKDNHVGFLYSGRTFADDSNQVIGLDLSYRLLKHGRFSASFLQSSTNKDSTGGETINGSNINATFLYYTKKYGFGWAHEYIGSDFNMDTAFITRTGLNHGWLWGGLYLYPKNTFLKAISPGVVYHYLHDFETGLDDQDLHLGVQWYFNGGAYLETKVRLIKEGWQGQLFDLVQYNFSGQAKISNWLTMVAIVYFGDYINYYSTPAYVGNAVNAATDIIIQPNKNLNQTFSFSHYKMKSGGNTVFKQDLLYSKTTYQFNKYFFLRGIVQYDSYQKRLLTDVLASFTLIPGTVVHVGYGGLHEKRNWMYDQWSYREGSMMNIRRGFFAKISYRWRL